MTPPHPNGDVRLEVERFGLLSAARVADRYRTLVEQAVADARDGDTYDNGGLSTLVRAYITLVDTAVRRLETAGEVDHGRVQLPSVRPGEVSQASLWVHNASQSHAADIRLEVTALAAAGGTRIGPETISLHPAVLSGSEPGPREVYLRIEVDPTQPPGTYHGFVIISSHPEDALAVSLRVEPT